ncbi:MAG TPA: GyrI-like domain-containing protein [Streptosporangiaceae bacterium]
MPEQPQVTRRAPQPYVGVPFTVTMATFPQAADAGFPEILGWLGARGITPSGPPFIRYDVIDMDGELEIEIGAPVAAALAGGGRVQAGELPGGRYVTLVHTGPYDGLIAANAALQDWARQQGIALESSNGGRRFRGRLEFYPTDPREEPDPARWQVEIAYLISDGA